jgi:hypothetical protein
VGDQGRGAETADAQQRRVDVTEIVLAILLGITAVLTAWATFQSSQLSGAVAAQYSFGIRAADAASQDYNDATAAETADEAIFLEYTKALHGKQTELAQYIHTSLMSPELAAAVDWWEDQPHSAALPTPFAEANPNWSNPLHDAAKKLDVEAEARFSEADRIDALSTAFDILSIILAIALFLFGVASLVRQERIKIGLGIVGVLILVFSIVRLIHLGNPAGVGLGSLW